MVQSTATYPNITHRLDKLNILVFWEILKSNNPYLLDVDYMEDKKYSEEEKQYIYHTWEIMYDSYFQLKNDGKSKKVLQDAYDLMLQASHMKSIESIMEGLRGLKEYGHVLPENDYLRHKQGYLAIMQKYEPTIKLKYFEGIDTNLAIIDKRLAALQNKYNRSKKDNEKDVARQVDNVFSVIVRVADTLNMHLDAQKLSVAEWIAWEKRAIEKIEAEKKAAEERKKKRR